MKVTITLGSNGFAAEGDDVTFELAYPAIELWVQAQQTDDLRLMEATKRLKAQNDALEQAVQANTIPGQ